MHKILEISGFYFGDFRDCIKRHECHQSGGLPNKRGVKQITSKLQERQNKLHPNYKSAKNKLEA